MLGIFSIRNIAFVTLIAIIVNQLDVEPVAYEESHPPAFKGALSANHDLEKRPGKAYFEGQIDGPEAIAIYNGEVYTSLLNGTIVKFRYTDGFKDNPKLTHVVHTGKKGACNTTHTEEHCGRPLGLRFNKNGDLYITDCYYGVLKFNTKTGILQTVFSSKDFKVNDKWVKFPNDLDVTKNSDIYFTDSTSKWYIKEGLLEFLESAPNGRLLHFDSKTGVFKELVSNLHFPNGVQLSPDESYLIFAETTRARINKYHIKGPKAGTVEIFADNLPGFPDNIRSNGRGGFWVGLCGVRLPDVKTPFAHLGPYPAVRKAIGKFFYLGFKTVEFVESIVKHIPLPDLHFGVKNVLHYMPHLSLGKYVMPDYGMIIELNQNGQITKSLHSPNGKVKYISHVEEHNGHLFLGSPWNRYVYKIKA